MRYDSASIYLLRNPYGDESLVDVVRAAAVCDAAQRVGTLVRCIEMPELTADFLSPDADICGHFGKYRPDLLVMPAELLVSDSFVQSINRLEDICKVLPFLVTLGRGDDETAFELMNRFPKRLHIDLFTDPFSAAADVRRFIVREVIDRGMLTEKLRRSAQLTLTAMHASGGMGFEYLLDEVTEVLENNFVFLGSAAALHRRISAQRGVSAVTVDTAVKAVVEKALAEMTEPEYRVCFTEYISAGVVPSVPEFVYAAAKLTSLSCTRLLYYLNDLPSKAPAIHNRSYE